MRTYEQMQKMKSQPGFIAALDQSGGSTPHALALYGIKDHAWKDDDEMFELVHQMRTRVSWANDCGRSPLPAFSPVPCNVPRRHANWPVSGAAPKSIPT